MKFGVFGDGDGGAHTLLCSWLGSHLMHDFIMHIASGGKDI